MSLRGSLWISLDLQRPPDRVLNCGSGGAAIQRRFSTGVGRTLLSDAVGVDRGTRFLTNQTVGQRIPPLASHPEVRSLWENYF